VIFGEIMQIHDDLNDCLASPANVDWLQGRAPLPILFAELAPHPQRERFLELRGQVADPAKLQEAQAILVSSGAISYCVNELLLRQRAAEKIVNQTSLADPQPLISLLEHAVAPVRNLFASVGAEFPAAASS
jgi:geranylgeranyl pyrophosphate synthase